MQRDAILARLREHEPALRARRCSARARGDDRPDSDTDIMIALDPNFRVSVFDYAGLKLDIASLFDGPVDVVNRDSLKPYVKPAATGDAIYAF
jgi:predicted nucleotidyltransferase